MDQELKLYVWTDDRRVQVGDTLDRYSKDPDG